MRKLIEIIKKFVVGGLGIAFFGFVIVMTILLLNFNDYGVAQIENTSFVIIREDISSEKYNKGDLVLVEGKKISKINADDELFVYKVDNTGVVTIDIGVVGKVHLEDEAVSFKNGSTFASEFIVGTAGEVYDDIGAYLAIIQSTWGFFFIILVPSFLIFIYQLYALIVEIKYGKDEIVYEPRTAS